jgi:hypothetical protein
MIGVLVKTDVRSIQKDSFCHGKMSKEVVRNEDVSVKEEKHGLEFRLSS